MTSKILFLALSTMAVSFSSAHAMDDMDTLIDGGGHPTKALVKKVKVVAPTDQAGSGCLVGCQKKIKALEADLGPLVNSIENRFVALEQAVHSGAVKNDMDLLFDTLGTLVTLFSKDPTALQNINTAKNKTDDVLDKAEKTTDILIKLQNTLQERGSSVSNTPVNITKKEIVDSKKKSI